LLHVLRLRRRVAARAEREQLRHRLRRDVPGRPAAVQVLGRPDPLADLRWPPPQPGAEAHLAGLPVEDVHPVVGAGRVEAVRLPPASSTWTTKLPATTGRWASRNRWSGCPVPVPRNSVRAFATWHASTAFAATSSTLPKPPAPSGLLADPSRSGWNARSQNS